MLYAHLPTAVDLNNQLKHLKDAQMYVLAVIVVSCTVLFVVLHVTMWQVMHGHFHLTCVCDLDAFVV